VVVEVAIAHRRYFSIYGDARYVVNNSFESEPLQGPSSRRGRRRALDDNDARRSDDTSEHGRLSLFKQRHTDVRQGARPIAPVVLSSFPSRSIARLATTRDEQTTQNDETRRSDDTSDLGRPWISATPT